MIAVNDVMVAVCKCYKTEPWVREKIELTPDDVNFIINGLRVSNCYDCIRSSCCLIFCWILIYKAELALVPRSHRLRISS